MNPLMNKQTQVPQNNINPAQLINKFMQNPVGALRQVGYNVPDGMSDPRQIVDYLINNGQLNNSKLGQLQNMARMFGIRR